MTSMTAQITFADARAGDVHPNQLRIEDKNWSAVTIFVDTVEGYDRILEEAQKGRDRLAATQTQAVA